MDAQYVPPTKSPNASAAHKDTTIMEGAASYAQLCVLHVKTNSCANRAWKDTFSRNLNACSRVHFPVSNAQERDALSVMEDTNSQPMSNVLQMFPVIPVYAIIAQDVISCSKVNVYHAKFKIVRDALVPQNAFSALKATTFQYLFRT